MTDKDRIAQLEDKLESIRDFLTESSYDAEILIQQIDTVIEGDPVLTCSRENGHDGPCNGWRKSGCPGE